jgi:glucosamine--fructose-6-phosphate aminotransferase (isomerizing)
VRTCHQEEASTHTVSYTASLTVLARIVAVTLGSDELADALCSVPDAMRATLVQDVPERAVKALTASVPAIVAGTGLDAITADEAALKIKEGTYRWAEGMHTEFALHGTPAVFSASTTAFLIKPSAEDGGRTADLRGLLTQLGAPVLMVDHSQDADLVFARTHPLVRPLVSVVPFQRLVSVAAVELGANPDLTHLEAEPWASAIRSVSL